MKTFSFTELNLVELSFDESSSTEGGSLPKWAKGGVWAYLATEIIDNWEAIKKGAKEGWNFDK
jgi:hypothetical protein